MTDEGGAGAGALGPGGPRPHRRELDGLRAVAVVLVVAFHSGVHSLANGFIGVDLFFVLSGFLITGLLLDAVRAGRVDLPGFYARRMRRLLPAALLVIVVTSVVWLAVAGVVERQPLVADARSAALYYANVHFAHQATDYFASANSPSPFVHFWSLSAEEQFYAVWPVIIALIAWAVRGRRISPTAVVTVVALLLAAASILSVELTERAYGPDTWAYFGTNNRAYELLAGAVLAGFRARRGPRHSRPKWRSRLLGVVGTVGQLAGLAGLVGLATPVVGGDPIERGLLVTGCAVVVLVALDLAQRGVPARLLSQPAPVYLGTISYGVYLWHWPVILVIRRFAVLGPGALFGVAFVVSTGLAALSARALEQPIRRSPRLGRRARVVVAGGLVLSAVVGLVAAPDTLAASRRPDVVPIGSAADPIAAALGSAAPGAVAATPSSSPSAASTAPGRSATPASAPPPLTPVPPLAQVKAASSTAFSHPCVQKLDDHVRACLEHKGSGATVLIVGDSHLEALFKPLTDLAAEHDVTMYSWIYYVCPWERDVLPASAPGSDNAAPCRNDKQFLYEKMLAVIHPDVVITVDRGYDDPDLPRPLFLDGQPDRPNAPGPVLVDSMPSQVSQMLQYTKRLVVIDPWPSLKTDPQVCLSTATYDQQCAQTVTPRPIPEVAALSAIAATNPRLQLVDLDDVVCPRLPICDPVVGGIIVRRDTDHLTGAFADSIESTLDQRLSAVGAFNP